MSIQPGEFWVAEIRYTDGTASKKRPVLVLWLDGQDAMVAVVTTTAPRTPTDVPLADWQIFCRLTQLSRLTLGRAGITDDMLKDLKKLPFLTDLNLRANPITGKGIKYIAEVRNLRNLVLDHEPHIRKRAPIAGAKLLDVDDARDAFRLWRRVEHHVWRISRVENGEVASIPAPLDDAPNQGLVLAEPHEASPSSRLLRSLGTGHVNL